MEMIAYLIFASLFLMLASIVWRYSSQRMILPCPVWLAWMVELDNPFVKANRASEIIQYLDLKTGMKVLDAGCGPGRVTIPIAQKIGSYGEVVAMDIQEGMLQKIQLKAQKEQLRNIRYLRAGLGDGQLEANFYDRALLVTVLGEIPNQSNALKELFAALKPGGVLSITEIIFDPHFQGKKTVLRLAQEVGFQEIKNIGSWFAFTILFQRPL